MTSPEFKFSQPAVIDISIVIVSFNTCEVLLRCLSSVQKYTEEISYEIIVVDKFKDYFENYKEYMRVISLTEFTKKFS